MIRELWGRLLCWTGRHDMRTEVAGETGNWRTKSHWCARPGCGYAFGTTATIRSVELVRDEGSDDAA